MKSYSNDIVTPETQTEAIKVAFMAQNAFISNQTNRIITRVTTLFAITYCTLAYISGVVIYLGYFK